MVLWVHLVLFMVFLKIYSCIKCTIETHVSLSASELVVENIKTIFNNLQRHESTMCQAYMQFDSITRTSMIKFGQTLELPHFRSVENAYIHATTSMISADSKKKMNITSIKTTVQLGCFSNDACDRQLVLEHLTRLIKSNYSNLQIIIHPLLPVKNDKNGVCTIGHEDLVKPCSGNTCSWYYSTDTKQGEGNCENNDFEILSKLNIYTEIRMFEKRKIHNDDLYTESIRAIFQHQLSIKFWCISNNCNNQKIGKSIKEIISKHYDLWTMPRIRKAHRK